jgi:hypothetical protein
VFEIHPYPALHLAFAPEKAWIPETVPQQGVIYLLRLLILPSVNAARLFWRSNAHV